MKNLKKLNKKDADMRDFPNTLEMKAFRAATNRVMFATIQTALNKN
jgi:hypothetical protein